MSLHIIRGRYEQLYKSSWEKRPVCLQCEHESGRSLKSVTNNLGNYNDNCDIYYVNISTICFIPVQRLYSLSLSRKVLREDEEKLLKKPVAYVVR